MVDVSVEAGVIATLQSIGWMTRQVNGFFTQADGPGEAAAREALAEELSPTALGRQILFHLQEARRLTQRVVPRTPAPYHGNDRAVSQAPPAYLPQELSPLPP